MIMSPVGAPPHYKSDLDVKRVFAIFALGLLCSASPAQPKPADPSPAESKILESLNHERAAASLPLLKWNAPAALAARAHSRLLAQHGEMSHQFEKEDSVPQRIAATGLRFTDSAENIAVADAPEEVHMALMLSPGHKANIMNPRYNSVGIGVFEAKGRLWVTQDFAWTVPPLQRRRFRSGFDWRV